MMKNILFIAAIILTFFAKGVVCAEPTVSSKISKAIISYLVQKDPAFAGKKIDISYKYAEKTFKDLKFRKGNVSFAVAELYPDFKPIGNIIVPIQVIVDDVPKEKLFLRTKVSVFDKIVVATKRFKRGDLIDTSNTALEERDIAVLSSGVIKDLDAVMGKEAKTYIPLSNAIYDWMIRERPLVKKNEKIKVMAFAENITIEAQGLSLQDGMLGQEIKAKNLTSGKELVCVVTGTGEAEVKQ